MWFLPDGTGLHAPFGHLVAQDGTGRLCCHLCGRWFRSLGSHVRVHGYTAAGYRADMGLCTGQALTAPDLSGAIAARQSQRYRNDVTAVGVRADLAVGQAMARDGSLAARSTAARRSAPEPEQRGQARAGALRQGRATLAAERAARRQRLVDESVHATLEDYLRDRYTAGASLQTLAAATGLGRSALREAVVAAGVTLRPSGAATAAGRRSRALRNEREVGMRLGTPDLHRWLRDRRAAGATLAELARATGRSYHWVAWRLEEPVAG